MVRIEDHITFNGAGLAIFVIAADTREQIRGDPLDLRKTAKYLFNKEPKALSMRLGRINSEKLSNLMEEDNFIKKLYPLYMQNM